MELSEFDKAWDEFVITFYEEIGIFKLLDRLTAFLRMLGIA